MTSIKFPPANVRKIAAAAAATAVSIKGIEMASQEVVGRLLNRWHQDAGGTYQNWFLWING